MDKDPTSLDQRGKLPEDMNSEESGNVQVSQQDASAAGQVSEAPAIQAVSAEQQESGATDDAAAQAQEMPTIQPAQEVKEPPAAPTDQAVPEDTSAGKGKRKTWARKMISDVLFVAVLLAVLAVIIQSVFTSEGEPRMIGGYSFQLVLTESMKSEIPPGSLVVVKKVSAESIEKGDVITFMQTRQKSVTHKVVQVLPNYDQKGNYGFRTHGVDNPTWDRDITDESNVIGKVVFHNFYLGVILTYVRARVWVIALVIVLIYILSISLRRYSQLTRLEKASKANGTQDPSETPKGN